MPSYSRAVAAAALRGDDALARAAADAAAPRRRLVAALRDAHAEASLRLTCLRAAAAAEPGLAPPLAPPGLLARLIDEAEEQLRRIELVFAHLPERPATGRVRRSVGRQSCGPGAMAAEERRGAAEARALRDLAHLAGQHLAARLLDMTAAERAAAACALEQVPGGAPGFNG
jgi:hypothetical protein